MAQMLCWWNRFGPMFVGDIRRQRVSYMRGIHQSRWHLDEMAVKINDGMHYLWRAVDHGCEILESIITKTQDIGAAPPFVMEAMKRFGGREKIVTHGLCSHGAAIKEPDYHDCRDIIRAQTCANVENYTPAKITRQFVISRWHSSGKDASSRGRID